MYEHVKTGCKHIPPSEQPLHFQSGYYLNKPRKLHSKFGLCNADALCSLQGDRFFFWYYWHDFLASKCHVLVRTNGVIPGYGFNEQVLISACGRDFTLLLQLPSAQGGSGNPPPPTKTIIVIVMIDLKTVIVLSFETSLLWNMPQ